MDRFIRVKIDKFCNHKMIYNKLPKTTEVDVGLDNMIILKHEFEKADMEIIEGVPFCFSKAEFDNIECERQAISIGETARRIHFLSFAYWGSTNESFRVVYESGAEEIIRVPFLDIGHRDKDSEHIKAWYGASVSTPKVIMSSGETIQMVSFHHSIAELHGEGKIKEIVFPDNFFVHIFGVTLEKEAC